MPSGNLTAAINEAIRMCWDESIGYTFGGDGNPDSNGYDCSAFVIRSLYRAGFNVPANRMGTAYMGPYLVTAGFTELSYSSGMQLQSGDIFVINDGSYGHTFFYVENINGYTDSSGRSASIGHLSKCKVEASSSRTSGYSYANGDPGTIPGDVNNPVGNGDHPRNGVGAHWEVWVHAYSSLTNGHSDNTVKVYRWSSPYDPQFDDKALVLLGSLLLFRRK